jgi:excisionase family DNA binding protein
MEGYMTTQEAALALDVTPRRVRQLIREGKLPAIKIGEDPRSTYWIKPEDLALVEDRPSPGRPRKQASG